MADIKRLSFRDLHAHPDWDAWEDEYIAETASEAVPQPGAQCSRYETLDDQGALVCLGVVDGERLAGVAMLLVHRSSHYPFPIVATDAIYLRKPWRKGALGLELLRAMKGAAIAEGAFGLTFQAPPGSQLDKLCGALGMTHTHNIYWCAV